MEKFKYSLGYVVYKAPSESEYWEKIRQRGEQYYQGIDSILGDVSQEKLERTGELLINLGRSEKAKEIKLINQVTGNSKEYPDNEKGTIEFIRDLNEILIGKQQFENLLVRLRASKDFSEKNKDSKQLRAPTISSWFTSYFGTELAKGVNGFLNATASKIKLGDWSTWDKNFDSLVNRAIDRTVDRMFNKINDSNMVYGDSSHWKDLYNIYNSVKVFNRTFKQMIKQQINLDSFRSNIKKEINNFKVGSRKSGVRNYIDRELNLKNEKKSRSVGGNVQEYVQSIMAQAAGKYIVGNSGSRVMQNKTQVIDNVTLYSWEKEINFNAEKIVDLLSQSIRSNNLLDATQQMEKFYNQYLSHLSNTFIVYTNTKSYGLGNFRGFNGGTRKLEFAKSVLKQAGITNQVAEDFINCAYNTIPGAILEGSSIIEAIKVKLAQAMANLFFDDWNTLGQNAGGATAIHVFSLSGMQYPLSCLLEAAGKAIKNSIYDAQKYFKVSIHVPNKVMYEVPLSNQIEIHSKEDVYNAWNEQMQQAKNNSTFTIRFLSNFNSIISKFI